MNRDESRKKRFIPLAISGKHARIDVWKATTPAVSMTQHDVKHGESSEARETMENVWWLFAADVK